ncbi:MAG: CvpA family protein [Desulfitobacterium sp.]|nr:CvpA family protein [Desulfitobacterium sp.]
MNPFDILIFIIILFGAIQGFRKGLISGIISLGCNIIGLILAARNYQLVKVWLETKTSLNIWIEKVIYGRVLSLVEKRAGESQEQALESIFSILPKEFAAFLEDFQLPDLQLYSSGVLETIARTFTQSLTSSIMSIISFFLIFIIVIIIGEIIASIILSTLGTFKRTINRGGGFLVGGLVSFLGLAIFFGLLSPIISFITSNGGLESVRTSIIYPHLLNSFTLIQEFLQLNLLENLALPLDLDFQDFDLPLDWREMLPNPYNVDL